jgi:hypothetical protein
MVVPGRQSCRNVIHQLLRAAPPTVPNGFESLRLSLVSSSITT